MQKTLLYVGVLCGLLFSCLAEQDNPLAIGSCHDKILNQDEIDVDCGGRCGTTCELPEEEEILSPCHADLGDNVIYIDGVADRIAQQDIWFEDQFDVVKISANTAFGQLDIEILKELPERSASLAIGVRAERDNGDASLRLYDFLSYAAYSGELYIYYDENQHLMLELCEVFLISQTESYTISGRLRVIH